MSLITIFSFLGVAILLTLAPGPDILFITAQSIAKDKKSGIMTSLGLCTGLIVHITAACIGISAIIYQSVFLFSILKYAGAAYLLFLAYKAFTDKESAIQLNAKNTFNYKTLYRRGIIMNLLNPKVSLFFLALLPQFVDESNGAISIQMFILGLIFLVQTLIIFTFISIFAGKFGNLLRKSPTIGRKINIIQGSIFTLIGLSIAFGEE